MNASSYASVDGYLKALKCIAAHGDLKSHIKKILQAHFDSPDHTATWAEIAAKVGYKNRNAVQLYYGKFAEKLAAELGISEMPEAGFWLHVVVDWADDIHHETGHTQFTLRSEMIDALKTLNIVQASELIDELDERTLSEPAYEGRRFQVFANAYERNRDARTKCIMHYGARCVVCSFDFARLYGKDYEGFIHVHHLTPISRPGREYELNPVEDLRPVCANCHAAIHYKGGCKSIEEIKESIRTALQLKGPQP